MWPTISDCQGTTGLFESRLFDRFIMEHALIQATELTHLDFVDLTVRMSDSWDSRSVLRAPCRVFIFWKPPPPTFLKINFDSSVMGSIGGAGLSLEVLILD